ncbi:Tetratricopeptide repeat protein 39C, partial [Trichoplax sp. H2]
MESSDRDLPKATYNIDEAFLASEGIKMMINNNFNQAEQLFDKYRDFTPLMHAGSSFMLFMNAIITFEDEKLDLALKSLKATEKLCQMEENTLFKSISRSFRKKEAPIDELPLPERLQRYVIIADCSLYMAILTFVRQGITSYIKGGLMLRKAWKTYEKCYKMINDMSKAESDSTSPNIIINDSSIRSGADSATSDIMKDSDRASDECFEEIQADNGNNDDVSTSSLANEDNNPTVDPDDKFEEIQSENDPNSKGDSTEKQFQVLNTEETRDTKTIERLKGAIFFGYGLFNVCISLIPPRVVRLAQIFGFGGNREMGIKCLEFSSRTSDMKAPLAKLALLWYHVIIRPFYGLDGTDLAAGIGEAERIIAESKEYEESALFLFFQGRVRRIQKDILGSLDAFNTAVQVAKEQTAIQQLCCYERGWCHMINMNWPSAVPEFVLLKKESRWSQSYYTYLAAITLGASGSMKQASEQMKLVPQLARKRGNAPELFVIRKANQYKDVILQPHNYVLLILEVIYLWGAIRICGDHQLRQFLIETERSQESYISSLQVFMLGILHLQLRDIQLAEQYLKEAVRTSKKSRQDNYIAPYATYELGLLLTEHAQ